MDYQVIIPARKGSKRFPGKNTYPLNGISLISHTLLYAKTHFPGNKIWVNTDDPEVIAIAKSHEVNFTIRPDALGSDTISSGEILYSQASYFKSNEINCDAMVLLQATNPLRPVNLVPVALQLYEKHGRMSLASFSPLKKKYGKIRADYFEPSNYKIGQRLQDIEQDFFENGLIYITNIEAIEKKEVITSDVYPLIIETLEGWVDIDEPLDLSFAEFILKNNYLLKT